MSTEITEPLQPALEQPTGGRCRRPMLVLGIVGVVLVVAAPAVTRFVDWLLPLSFVTTSGGTALGSFGDLGPQLLRRLGVGFLLGAAAAAVPSSWWARIAPNGGRLTPTARTWTRHVVVPVVVFVPPFLAYRWLADPHNMFSTNSRIHWVDYFVNGDRADDFFYAFGQLPHTVFHDRPSLWQGINAGIFAVSMLVVLRRVGFRTLSAAAIALVASFGSMVLLFADTGEDVLINLMLLTWLIGAMTTRSAALRGLLLALAITGRPEFVSMLAVYAAVAAHDLWNESAERTTPWWRGGAARLHLLVFAWAAAGIVASQTVFEVLGRRYMFTNGNVLDLGPLADLTPFEFDGFTISPFSGAYIGHFFWVLPLGFLVGLAATVPSLLRRAPRRPGDHRVFVSMFAVTACVVSVLLHEVKPTQTFCVRYLSYTYPFVIVGGAIGLAGLGRARPGCRPAIWVVAVASLFALPVHPLDARDSMRARSETSLLPYMDDLRGQLDGRNVVVTFGGVSSRSAMSYLFMVPITEVSTMNKKTIREVLSDPQAHTVVVAALEQGIPVPDDAVVIARTDTLVAFRLG